LPLINEVGSGTFVLCGFSITIKYPLCKKYDDKLYNVIENYPSHCVFHPFL